MAHLLATILRGWTCGKRQVMRKCVFLSSPEIFSSPDSLATSCPIVVPLPSVRLIALSPSDRTSHARSAPQLITPFCSWPEPSSVTSRPAPPPVSPAGPSSAPRFKAPSARLVAAPEGVPRKSAPALVLVHDLGGPAGRADNQRTNQADASPPLPLSPSSPLDNARTPRRHAGPAHSSTRAPRSVAPPQDIAINCL